jgi:hypothetical protein
MTYSTAAPGIDARSPRLFLPRAHCNNQLKMTSIKFHTDLKHSMQPAGQGLPARPPNLHAGTAREDVDIEGIIDKTGCLQVILLCVHVLRCLGAVTCDAKVSSSPLTIHLPRLYTSSSDSSSPLPEIT